MADIYRAHTDRPPAIVRLVQTLQATLAEVEKDLAALESRLAPVLPGAQATGGPEVDLAQPEPRLPRELPPGSPLGLQLHDVSERAAMISRHVLRILRQLEV